MLLIGDQDIINKKKVVKKARKIIPQTESEIIENAGHFLSMDQSEVINSKIIDFLKSNTSNYVIAY
jgi:pimeloyl-ACP methyl ester carboxylesterase